MTLAEEHSHGLKGTASPLAAEVKHNAVLKSRMYILESRDQLQKRLVDKKEREPLGVHRSDLCVEQDAPSILVVSYAGQSHFRDQNAHC